MGKERKILSIVTKYNSFQEAEDAEDNYWSDKSELERLEALMDIRESYFETNKSSNIQKVAFKRFLNEETES